MIKIDRGTHLIINDALYECVEANSEQIETQTKHKQSEFKKFYDKYIDDNSLIILEADLPLILASLEWMIITSNNYDILQVTKEDGLALLKVLKSKSLKVSVTDWMHNPV